MRRATLTEEERRERKQERDRRYYKENREALLEGKRRYRKENREAIQERDRRYYEENREAILEKSRRYYEENREIVSAKQVHIHRKIQAVSLAYATNNGCAWSGAEDAIAMRDDIGLLEIAYLLGRTCAAVAQRRSTLSKQGIAA